MNAEQYIKIIEEVIEKGQYKDNWSSLSNYPEAEWYKDAKFGIFIHWGVYSVPAFGNEWYPRRMYIEGSKEYEHHIKTYGDHKDFKYEDFIPMFKAEKFDADKWIDLFKEAGAKYIMPVAEHHDGFQMYDSALSDWNAKKMGPKRDVVAELKEASEKNDIIFSVSNHRAENCWFMGGARKCDEDLAEITFQEPYGFAMRRYGVSDEGIPGAENKEIVAPKEHLDDWLARACELVDKYQPKIVWFDWWITRPEFKPYLKKFAAYYYNRALEWGVEVAINYKYDAYALGTAIFDVERGQLAAIRPRFWQTDTAVAKNSWGYTENNEFKTPESIVCDLIDIVSKNGCLLLNVGPKADGTISDEDTHILKEIGKWLKVNGESIYNTRFWSTFGEGPTEVKEGAFTDTKREDFTPEDIRFTYKAPYVYANVLKWPETQEIKVKAMCNDSEFFKGQILDVELIGFNEKVTYTKDNEALKIKVDGKINTSYPVCFKIKID